MTTQQFTCGHSAEGPRNMGRGKARQARLATYFNRKCFDCASESIRRLYGSLTDLRGNPSPRPDKAEERIASLRYSY